MGYIIGLDIEYKNKLIEEIEKSGFPLELEVFQKLRLMGCTVLPNISYIDKSNNIREIDDIVILDNGPCNDWPFGCIQLHVLFECKSIKKHPWIFFADPDPYPASLLLGLSSNLKFFTDIESKFGLLAGHMNTELKNHHYNNCIPTARTYCEAFGNDAGINIYKAVQSLWNAIAFNIKSFESKSGTSIEQNKKRSIFMQGVIVLKGELLLATKDNDTFDIEPVQHVILRTIDCLTDKRSSLVPYRETIIDVISEEYVEEFMEICKNDLNNIVSFLSNLSKTDWIVKT